MDAFGVAATVTRPAPNNSPIQTTVVWMGPSDMDSGDPSFERREQRRQLSILKPAVDAAPIGTLISAPEYEDGPVKAWRVASCLHARFDETRVIVELV